MGKRLLTAIVLAVTLGAQTPSYIRTGGAVNGRYWQRQQFYEKAGFLVGYWAAIEFINTYLDGKCTPCDGMTPLGYTNAEIIPMLDTFYRTPENAPIPIYWALGHLWQKLNNGQSPKEQAQYLQTIRQWASTAPQGSQ